MGCSRSLGTTFVRGLATVSLATAAVVVMGFAGVSPAHASSSTLVISEFRARGASGVNDEFVEIQNIGFSSIVVTSAGASTGFAVVASDGVVRCVIPNSTTIPAFGHFLCTNSIGYQLFTYPGASGAGATGNATFATDIPDQAGIALFNTSLALGFVIGNRIDAVGPSTVSTLYREGAGLPPLTPNSSDSSWFRNLSTSTVNTLTPSVLDTATPGVSEDTDDNLSDFVFVDTNGISIGGGQRLGAPGPENLAAPVPNGGLAVSLFDPCVSADTSPNAVVDTTSVPGQNSTFGTTSVRRTITNNTGGTVTRLRFRVADQRTFPAASGFADLRDRTSTDVSTTVDRTPCGVGTSSVTAHGTTLEEGAVTQPNGGGFNSSFSVGSVSVATPLLPGASVDVQFLFGLQQTGKNSTRVIIEAQTTGSITRPYLACLGATGIGVTSICAGLAPVSAADGYVGIEDTPLTVAAPGVLANDFDPDAGSPGTVKAASVSSPVHGTVTVNANGSFSYTPAANYNGPDSFTYQSTDGTLDSAVTTVTLTIGAVNDAPVAGADAYSVSQDSPLTVGAPGVLVNDTDVDGPVTVKAGSASTPAHGALALNGNGSFTYTPAAGYTGPDSFTYKITDGVIDSASTTVSLTVIPTPAPSGATRFVPLAPLRLLDTREAADITGGLAVAADTSIDLQILGRAGVPSTNVASVVLNVTAAQATAPGYVTVWPSLQDRPTASNLNVTAPGQNIANLVTVRVGANGKVAMYTQSGTHFVVDVAGYYEPATVATSAGRYTALAPSRILDTRSAVGVAGTSAVPAGGQVDLLVAGQGGVPVAGVAAVVLNVTAAEATVAGFVTVWPAGLPRPTASTLNVTFGGQNIPNAVIVPLGADGKISLFTQSGTQFLADVAGWFGDATQPASFAGLFEPLAPIRVLDTRAANGTSTTSALQAGGSVDLVVAGRGGVPATGVSAAVLNVTAAEAVAPGFVTVWPTANTRPTTSIVNVTAPGQNIANLAFATLGAGGSVSLFTQGGTHLLADVAGYYISG
ncbi:MAG: sorting protein [Ilumatobacteraceae bacterium]|nr:sorting protein [Ilumatobacteraceae bacterium]